MNTIGKTTALLDTETEIALLRAENARLHETMQELQEKFESLQHVESYLRKSEVLLHGLLDYTPAAIFVKDRQGRYLLVNHLAASYLQHTPEDMIGKTDEELFSRRVVERWRLNDQPVIETGKPMHVEVVLHQEDGLHTYLTIRFPLINEEGEVFAIGGISTDITERKQTEAAKAIMQLKLSDAHREALRELSTPIIPIADGVMILPLIGLVDEDRAQQVLETLLEGVATYQSHTVIVDITGIKVVDAHVVQGLVQAAKAVKLLGAQVILTGIQPQMAQTMVHLHADLTGIVTRGTLQAGVAYALGR